MIIKPNLLASYVVVEIEDTFKAYKMNFPKKNTYSFKYKEPNVESLKTLLSQITSLKRKKFQITKGIF